MRWPGDPQPSLLDVVAKAPKVKVVDECGNPSFL